MHFFKCEGGNSYSGREALVHRNRASASWDGSQRTCWSSKEGSHVCLQLIKQEILFTWVSNKKLKRVRVLYIASKYTSCWWFQWLTFVFVLSLDLGIGRWVPCLCPLMPVINKLSSQGIPFKLPESCVGLLWPWNCKSLSLSSDRGKYGAKGNGHWHQSF